jgi:hypothetical protein
LINRFSFLLLVLSLSGTLIATDDTIKSPPPTGSALTAATDTMNEAYRDDLSKAITPAQQDELAWRMFKTARDTANDSAGQYVLLTQARDEAALAGDPDNSFWAIEELKKNYKIDVVQMQVDTLAIALRKMPQTADFPEVVEMANTLTDTAVTGDRYDLANQAIAIARLAADRAGYPTLTKYVAQHASQVRAYAEAYEGIIASTKTLAKTPTDPTANYTVGRFRCFVKNDWTGLLMLSLGSDAALKNLATKDLAGATTAEDQVELGDAWWSTAEKETGSIKDHIRLRAGKWYIAAYKQLAGLEQAKVIARINLLIR